MHDLDQILSDLDQSAGETADALSDLDAAEIENPGLSSQFFGESPFSLEQLDLPESEEMQDLSAQFFGNNILDYGTLSPLAQEDKEEEQRQKQEDAEEDGDGATALYGDDGDDDDEDVELGDEMQQLSVQFFGDNILDYGTPSPLAREDSNQESEDLGDEMQQLSAQFFGDNVLNFGTPSPLAKEDEEEEQQQKQEEADNKSGDGATALYGDADEDIDGEWGDILREAKEGVLGDVSTKSSAFNDYVARRIAQTIPVVGVKAKSWRDWQIDFGPVSAPAAGERLRVFQTIQDPFRGEKIMATDSATPAGTGTIITDIIVGNHLQRPAQTYSLTAFFSQQALGNGITFDVASAGIRITIGVSFLQACTFYLSVFGKALLGQG